jgi:phenylacetate-CoA ligase
MINFQKPQYFYGYASALYLLAQLMMKKNIKLKYKRKALFPLQKPFMTFNVKPLKKFLTARLLMNTGQGMPA